MRREEYDNSIKCKLPIYNKLTRNYHWINSSLRQKKFKSLSSLYRNSNNLESKSINYSEWWSHVLIIKSDKNTNYYTYACQQVIKTISFRRNWYLNSNLKLCTGRGKSTSQICNQTLHGFVSLKYKQKLSNAFATSI